MKDSVESKLWGIGSEAFVVGSHEFYLGYALTHGKMVCLDTGHFHPTESVADKVSAILQFSDELLLHVSRGVRWDSDHVVVIDASELVTLSRGRQGRALAASTSRSTTSTRGSTAWARGCSARGRRSRPSCSRCSIREFRSADEQTSQAAESAGAVTDDAGRCRLGLLLPAARRSSPAMDGWRKCSCTKGSAEWPRRIRPGTGATSGA